MSVGGSFGGSYGLYNGCIQSTRQRNNTDLCGIFVWKDDPPPEMYVFRWFMRGNDQQIDRAFSPFSRELTCPRWPWSHRPLWGSAPPRWRRPSAPRSYSGGRVSPSGAWNGSRRPWWWSGGSSVLSLPLPLRFSSPPLVGGRRSADCCQGTVKSGGSRECAARIQTRIQRIPLTPLYRLYGKYSLRMRQSDHSPVSWTNHLYIIYTYITYILYILAPYTSSLTIIFHIIICIHINSININIY